MMVKSFENKNTFQSCFSNYLHSLINIMSVIKCGADASLYIKRLSSVCKNQEKQFICACVSVF